MANGTKGASKHDYDKTRLKERIDAATELFLKKGKIERVATRTISEALMPAEPAPAPAQVATTTPSLPTPAAPKRSGSKR
jgi:hypothetical protein